MKRLLLILIFTLSFPLLVSADQIREVEIEGISIGDSLLDHFTKKEIKKATQKDWFTNKKYTVVVFKKKIETYEELQVAFLTDDKEYKVQSVSGLIKYKDNINECYKKAKNIYEEIKDTLPELEDYGKYVYEHNDDPEGSVTDYALLNNKKDEVFIGCYDYSKNYNAIDNLRIGVRLFEYSDFLINEAYK